MSDEDSMVQSFFEAAPDAIFIVNAVGKILRVNAQGERLFGYSRSEMSDRFVDTLVSPRFRSASAQHRAGPLASRGAHSMVSGGELECLRKDGQEFPVEISVSPFDAGADSLLSIAIRDISERRHTEEMRVRLAAIVESSHDAIIGRTLEGRIMSWNQAAQRIFGYSSKEAIGEFISMLVPAGREEEDPLILERLRRGEAAGAFDTVRRRKDGRLIHVSVMASLVRDPSGAIVGSSKVVRDISERRKAETLLVQANLAAQAANRELEAFSYSVAHDLRAPLRGMHGFARVLLDTYRDKLDADGQDWLEEILLNANKMGALIDALLSLARITRTEPKHEFVDLSSLANTIVAQLQQAEPERRVEAVISPDLTADIDPDLARALLENLLGNAWKFTSKSSAARIEVGREKANGVDAFFVRDNGAGFDMAFAKKLFAPFQRLHGADEFPGTGIGLASVQRIVHRHGGTVWAEGAVNSGASIFFELPNAAKNET